MELRAIGRRILRGWMPALAIAGLLILAGCATSQPYNRGGYGTTYSNGRTAVPTCRQCGTVESVQQVYIGNGNDSNVLGTVIGAVAGGALGSTVGSGKGKTAATIGGAVAGGAVGHSVEEHSHRRGSTGYRVVVKLDDGRVATVTQRPDPHVRLGDRVRIRNNLVHRL